MFVLIRSWHIVLQHEMATIKTYCGRKVIETSATQVVAGLPDGRTCESCFRVRESRA